MNKDRTNSNIDIEQNILDYCALEELWGANDVYIDTADGHIEVLHLNDEYAKKSPRPVRLHPK